MFRYNKFYTVAFRVLVSHDNSHVSDEVLSYGAFTSLENQTFSRRRKVLVNDT